MPNIIDKNGITVQSINEITESLKTAYKAIYGNDIVLDSDTPDGQRIGIEAQAKADILDLAVQIYNSHDVDYVIGRSQDILYKLNNIYRKSAKYSFVQVNITVNAPVNLQGLDADINNPDGIAYTVSNSNNDQFLLTNSVSLTSAGTYLLEFRAKDFGALTVSPNTINVLVTVIAGVVSANNPAIQYITGTSEETDAEFRLRRSKSTALNGKGFYDSLLAQLQSIDNVKTAIIYENDTNMTNSDGSLPHTIWCIVEGGLDAEIAAAIYANKTFGCGLRGDTSVLVTKSDGSKILIKFDRPQSENLYINLVIKAKTLGYTPNINYIKTKMVENISFGIYESADITSIASDVIQIDNNIIVTTSQISLNGSTWVDYLTPTNKRNFFTLAAARITITVTP